MEGPLNKGNFERLLQSEFRTVSNGRELSKSLALLATRWARSAATGRYRGRLIVNSLFISARKKAFGVSYVGTASVFLFLFSSTSSYAISSPDLVVGSLSSISQLIAIVSAMIGGGAAVAGMRATANGRANRIVRLIAAGAALFLGLSLAGNCYQYSTQRSERQARLDLQSLDRQRRRMDTL